MAITCKWEKPLATATRKDGGEVVWYGGGNCLFVSCFKGSRCLENFACDEKHFKNCEHEPDSYKNIVVSLARKAEAKKLIKCLIDGGFDFNVTQAELIGLEPKQSE